MLNRQLGHSFRSDSAKSTNKRTAMGQRSAYGFRSKPPPTIYVRGGESVAEVRLKSSRRAARSLSEGFAEITEPLSLPWGSFSHFSPLEGLTSVPTRRKREREPQRPGEHSTWSIPSL
jgi:hypothetical protein